MQHMHTDKPSTLYIMRTLHGVHVQASQPPYVYVVGYGCAIHASQTIFIKINCLTFWHPKYDICKPEHDGKDSHCHAQ